MSSVSSTGTFTTSTSIQVNAVNAAMNNPTCVAISMSYGGTSGSSTLSNAFATTRTQGRGGKGLRSQTDWGVRIWSYIADHV